MGRRRPFREILLIFRFSAAMGIILCQPTPTVRLPSAQGARRRTLAYPTPTLESQTRWGRPQWASILVRSPWRRTNAFLGRSPADNEVRVPTAWARVGTLALQSSSKNSRANGRTSEDSCLTVRCHVPDAFSRLFEMPDPSSVTASRSEYQ